MNVRFFAGSKKQYIGLTKQDRTALYFCYDTRELFWGDKLLSDGIRVVATKNDLPSLATAADGIIYYVVECRNGYVLSQDRTNWVQVIHAPAVSVYEVPEGEASNTAVSVTAIREIENTIYEKIASIENLNKIKTISFAGVALDRADGVFSIERDAALKALGISFTEGSGENEIEVVATKEYVDTQIAEVSKVDLSEYAKKSELPVVDGLASEEFVIKKIAEAELADQDVDLSTYYTKSETEAAIKTAVDAIEIPKVPTKVSELENDAGYITKDTLLPSTYWIDFTGLTEGDVVPTSAAQEAFNRIMIGDDISIYIQDESISVYSSELSGYHPCIIDKTQPYAGGRKIVFTVENHTYRSSTNEVNVIYKHNSTITVIKKNGENEWKMSISSSGIESYATPTYVDNAIANIPETDLSNYYNKTETEKLITEAVNDIEHPTVDLEGYATEEWVNAQGFLKEHQDLSDYAKKSDIPEAELFVVDFNAPDFIAAFRAYNSGKLLLLANAAPDTNSYAMMNYVREDMITFTKFLMSRSGTYGSFNAYYLHNNNTWELAKEVRLNKVEAVADADKINGITIGKETYTFDYATTETVNQINQSIQNIENTYVTNETLEQKSYVTEQYVLANYTTTEELETIYVTNNEVTELVTNEVEEVITQKIEDGNLVVNADAINYDTW